MRSIDKIRDDMEKSLAMGGFHYNAFEQELRAAYTDGIPLDKVEEICNAERDGRCEVLPCEVGDTVYCTNTGKIKEDVVISYRYDGTWSFMLENTGSVHWTIERFNRTVFLTREAAEQAKERD